MACCSKTEVSVLQSIRPDHEPKKSLTWKTGGNGSLSLY